jgi:hypothetical protein
MTLWLLEHDALLWMMALQAWPTSWSLQTGHVACTMVHGAL